MAESNYYFDDPKAAFAEAENRIQRAVDKGVRTLDLSCYGLLQVPESVGQLEHLTELNLSFNRLSDLPFSVGELLNLESLYLAGNQFVEIPQVIDSLRALKYLDLSSNRLKGLWLPYTCRSLRTLDLRNNDELGLPPEVVNGADAEAIYWYFTELEHSKRPLNEAKLILLGRGEVGKTCLVNRLVHDRFKSTSMTRGVAITHWAVEIAVKPGKLHKDEILLHRIFAENPEVITDTIRLHLWDFGGQEIQHATHQFFLTERSLYLVVLNGRTGAEDEDAEYWLKFVKTFGGSSPTIVVLNKFKVQPFQVNRRALQEKYPFIRAFVQTDCRPKSKNGIPELKQEIESALATMEHVRADFPAGWFQIKDRLAEMKEPFISFAEYREICAGLGEKDAQAQERLAGFLSALGIALNFREDPQLREETVLHPHWITEGVYQIITSKTLAERQGELRLADLGRILPKNSYPARMHGFLIELMRKFELCFPFHDDPAEHRYLVPELLGKEEPALKEPFPPAECMIFRYDYRLMPEGILPRFITRTHTMSEVSERWRTGVVLRWEGCRALVKADKQERQVIVRILGEPEKRRRLLAVIRENFDQIHAEMKEFRPTEWVALEGHPEEWVNHRELEILEQKQVKELPKSVGTEVVSVDVTKVLNGADVAGARECGAEQIGEKRPLKLFISYAHEDERWRAKLSPNLALLERERLIEVWCDLQIMPGDDWNDEIKRKLNEADIFLFLMSTDMLASKYVQDVELPIARMRHEGKTARIVPVVLRACSWVRYLGDIQGLPSAGRPVKEWPDKDQAFHDVEEGLRKTIAEVQGILHKL